MATLTDDEIPRIKAEVFDNVLDIGAVPYASILAVYDLIRDNVISSSVAATTSSTAVTAVGSNTLTVATPNLHSAFQRVVLDVDDARETCTVKAAAASTIVVQCRYLHAGTYPVQVESPLTIVRGILSDLITLEQVERGGFGTAGLRKVDEVEFFGKSEGGSLLAVVATKRNELRARLASACGLTRVLREYAARVGSGGGGIEVY